MVARYAAVGGGRVNRLRGPRRQTAYPVRRFVVLFYVFVVFLFPFFFCDNRPPVLHAKGPFLVSAMLPQVRSATAPPRLLLLLPHTDSDRSALLRYCALLADSGEGQRCGVAAVPGVGRLLLYAANSDQTDVSLMGLIW